MSEIIRPDILDKLTKICICKGISKADIKKAISAGAHTVEQIQQKTGAGSGSCNGNRCLCRISDLLQEIKK